MLNSTCQSFQTSQPVFLVAVGRKRDGGEMLGQEGGQGAGQGLAKWAGPDGVDGRRVVRNKADKKTARKLELLEKDWGVGPSPVPTATVQ